MNKLVNQYSKTYQNSINKKPINSNYSALTETIETNHKAPKYRVNDRIRITKCKNIFNKGYTENWSRQINIIDWTHKMKDLYG